MKKLLLSATILPSILVLWGLANASTPGTSAGYSVTTASTQVLTSNSGRVYWAIVNQGPAIVYCAVNSSNAATTSNGIPIPAGGNWTEAQNVGGFSVVPQGDVACITASGSATVTAVDK